MKHATISAPLGIICITNQSLITRSSITASISMSLVLEKVYSSTRAREGKKRFHEKKKDSKETPLV